MEAAAFGAMYGFLAIFMAIYWVVIIGVVVLQYIAQWKIFVKAGEPGWKCLVPFLNGHTLYKLFWKPVYYYLTMVMAVVLLIPTLILQSQIIFTGEPSLGLTMFVLFLSLVVLVVDIIWAVKLYLGMARSFGYGGGFAAGLFFLPTIFLLILAFNKDTYKGNTYVKKAAPTQEPWVQPPVMETPENKTEE